MVRRDFADFGATTRTWRPGAVAPASGERGSFTHKSVLVGRGESNCHSQRRRFHVSARAFAGARRFICEHDSRSSGRPTRADRTGMVAAIVAAVTAEKRTTRGRPAPRTPAPWEVRPTSLGGSLPEERMTVRRAGPATNEILVNIDRLDDTSILGLARADWTPGSAARGRRPWTIAAGSGSIVLARSSTDGPPRRVPPAAARAPERDSCCQRSGHGAAVRRSTPRCAVPLELDGGVGPRSRRRAAHGAG